MKVSIESNGIKHVTYQIEVLKQRQQSVVNAEEFRMHHIRQNEVQKRRRNLLVGTWIGARLSPCLPSCAAYRNRLDDTRLAQHDSGWIKRQNSCLHFRHNWRMLNHFRSFCNLHVVLYVFWFLVESRHRYKESWLGSVRLGIHYYCCTVLTRAHYWKPWFVLFWLHTDCHLYGDLEWRQTYFLCTDRRCSRWPLWTVSRMCNHILYEIHSKLGRSGLVCW